MNIISLLFIIIKVLKKRHQVFVLLFILLKKVNNKTII